MKMRLFTLIGFSSFVFLTGCGGTSQEKLEVPTNMPPACRDIDFIAQPEMREMCGVRTVHFQAYKNIPQQRYLIKPQNASLVRTDKKLELRLENTLPVDLTGPIVNEVSFTQDKRLEKIRNQYDYFEFYPEGGTRVRIFKLTIPTDAGTQYSYCFRVPPRRGSSRTRNVAMGNEMEQIGCDEYDDTVRDNVAASKIKNGRR